MEVGGRSGAAPSKEKLGTGTRRRGSGCQATKPQLSTCLVRKPFTHLENSEPLCQFSSLAPTMCQAHAESFVWVRSSSPHKNPLRQEIVSSPLMDSAWMDNLAKVTQLLVVLESACVH